MIKVAVITPYYNESLPILRRAHDSVLAQTHPCDHIIVSDGKPMAEVDAWNAYHIKVKGHRDVGDTPRVIGAASASALGYDAILLLDADNFFDPDHVETLLKVQKETKAAVVTCVRKLIRPHDLTLLAVDAESNGDAFNDTNCLLMTRPTFPLFAAWGFKDPALGPVGDRIFWGAVKKSGVSIARSEKPTVNYVTTYGIHFVRAGEAAPSYAKDIVRTPDGVWRILTWSEAQKIVGAAAAAAVPAPATTPKE